ncbi:MAG: ABC transporter permease, partial [Sporomusaceae bacterium]|nr:ABC transporter permease [Sporomusaceae bacterium]
MANNFWRRFFRHRAGNISLIFLITAAIFTFAAPYLPLASPTDTNMSAIRQAPQSAHLLGTDDLGRDILSRLLYGGQVSLLVGLSSVFIATTAGILFGLLSGYAGALIDTILMRIIDGLLSIPTLVLVVVVQSVSSPGLLSVVLVIAATTWMQTARIVRTEFLSVKQRPFVKAALACGASDFKIVFRHILPNCMASVVVLATINVGHAIVTESALSFLGMGIPPHQPS